MKTYHKIQSIFKRDPETNYKTFLMGQWTTPEFEYLRDHCWTFTEKVDGTNIRVRQRDGQFDIQGKTDRAQLHPDLLSNIKGMFGGKLMDIFEGEDVCLYGEGYGAGIQKGGGQYQEEKSFVLFDVLINGVYLCREDVEDVAKNLSIPVVPVIGEGTLHDAISVVTSGLTSQWGPFEAEGIVARPSVELRDRRGGRIITKIKACDFKEAA